jgi:hypothetical protein
MEPIVVDPKLRDPRFGAYAQEWRDGHWVVPSEEIAQQLREGQLHTISSQYLISAVEPHFEKLSLNIFPRILELDEQAELISAFIRVESAFRDWNSNVDTIEEDWGMPERYAWKAAAEFCAQIGEMLKIIHLDERKSEQSPDAPGGRPRLHLRMFRVQLLTRSTLRILRQALWPRTLPSREQSDGKS